MPPAQIKKGIYPMEKEITVQERIENLENRILSENVFTDEELIFAGINSAQH